VSEGTRALLRDAAESEGLSPAQTQTLRFVARTKTFMASIGNLAAALGTTHVNAVKLASGLERKGLLTREQSSWDGRVSLLRLTEAGTQAVRRLARWERELERTLSALPARERAALEPALGAVVRSLEAAGLIAVGEPCRGCVYFEEEAAPGAREPHRCRLIQRHLSEREARLDCPDHTKAAA
jgi:DNA-binding MarR family transcriptional regulator